MRAISWNVSFVFSCSVMMFGFPVSLRSFAARRLRITGAYVSGTRPIMIVMAPAKARFTQKKRSRRPDPTLIQPVTIGPSTGPQYGAAAK